MSLQKHSFSQDSFRVPAFNNLEWMSIRIFRISSRRVSNAQDVFSIVPYPAVKILLLMAMEFFQRRPLITCPRCLKTVKYLWLWCDLPLNLSILILIISLVLSTLLYFLYVQIYAFILNLIVQLSENGWTGNGLSPIRHQAITWTNAW